MRPRRRCPGSPSTGAVAACPFRYARMRTGGIDSRHALPDNRIATMKINKWVLAAILFLFAAGMYAAVIVKMS